MVTMLKDHGLKVPILELANWRTSYLF